MLTFLEFVARKLMGPPHAGRRCWRCPWCDSRSPCWHVRPPSADGRERFGCYRCGAWGDAHDLLRDVGGVLDYSERRIILARWEAEWLAGAGTGTHAHHVPPSRGSRPATDPREVALAWGNLTARERALLRGPWRRRLRVGVPLEALRAYDAALGAWVAAGDKRHAGECRAPAECDDAPCRRARGLPALTARQVRAGRYTVDGHRKGA